MHAFRDRVNFRRHCYDLGIALLVENQVGFSMTQRMDPEDLDIHAKKILTQRHEGTKKGGNSQQDRKGHKEGCLDWKLRGELSPTEEMEV